MGEGLLWPEWSSNVNRELSDLISRLRNLGIEVRDIGMGTASEDWAEVAGVQLPGFTARISDPVNGHQPAFDLSVRYHPFRRIWMLQTQPKATGLLGRLPDPVTIQLLRRGSRNDSREIATIIKDSSPDIISAGSIRGTTGGSPLADIVETAVITATVVPFIQSIATKAGEDSYQWLKQAIKAQAERKSQGRHSLKKRTKRGRERRAAEASASQDINCYVYDSATMTLLVIPSSAQEDALHGLSSIDIEDICGKVLTWSTERHSWVLAVPPLEHSQTAVEFNEPPQEPGGADRGE